MSKFKKGDKVKCLRGFDKGTEVGDIATVTSLNGDYVRVNGHANGYVENHYELIQDTKFKVGDRVRVLKALVTPSLEGTIRTITSIEDGMTVVDGSPIGWSEPKDCLELITEEPPLICIGDDDYKLPNDIDLSSIEPGQIIPMEKINKDNKFKTIMKKLTPMLKRMLDKKAQTLYKAGYINGDLELTETGRDALQTITFDTHRDALVTSATEALKEEEDNK